ncbi:site-specific DNA-methyltransferase [Fusobacterium sp. SYSU M8D902]|uniref:DNA-methyltransferase n=1 Tax=Fusobacterium sp. SYSU M8D902 TaxID=3159562 RepID=UPI0032E4D8C2
MVELYHGDCLKIMDQLIEKNIKVDLILTDPPYQKTKNKWDCVIPFDEMWKRLKKLRKENTPIILFGQGIFSAKLILSNQEEYRYSLIWNKEHPSGFLNANKMPLSSHEDILVFYKKLPTYNPQKFKGKQNNSTGNTIAPKINNNYNNFIQKDNSDRYGDMKFPRSILNFKKPHPSVMIHPTQKPTELLEYLIKTYSNENDLVLDFTMGSGSAGVACSNTNRNFIGIEIDKKYYELAINRMVG